MNSNKTYIDILIQSLQEKIKILDHIIRLSDEQDILLSQELSMDIDEFDKTIEEKGNLIEKVNELNDGFQTLYEKVKEELICRKNEYATEIQKMQELIKVVTDKSIEIQVKEKRNSMKLQRFLKDKSTEIKEFKKNSSTVASYYKSMSTQHQGQSYFIDKKK